MPKAILAIRTYPATVILALLLFFATLVITAGSMGKVTTGGGDSGDGGSGIGGTGRSGEFGGSGFGGTGGPSPFITSADAEQRETDASDATDIAAPVTTVNISIAEQSSAEEQEPAAQVAAASAQPASDQPAASPLQRAITESIEQNALVKQNELILAVDDTAEPLDSVIHTAVPVISVPQEPEGQNESVMPEDYELASIAEPATIEPVTNEQVDAAIPMLEQHAETLSVKMETAESGEPGIDRRNLPDRIQRPDLPPIQRIRPVERVSIMPPRVQPMRI